ncbi:hypothetical protein AMES_5604 [Amycolatopsis mediterranei S699]|uniref:Transposase IS701-like DDE domain-containing protein n=2 Tax=Amycolatopsis mediterranei TaxID=33910 RepID=A0A0H3DCR7_AMYMU|nr:transposase [Amycolatopsis mediterranei]ADJ47429.1 conserved hypothetical protein [Amycolatopsis mediterranei U32]AEK44276.1 hypothetical protein RAM_28995 [Amycolatopsis mediterranei S699]AFO79140.1 hypothetical protein AMES_5604 [Amycolatopsis mediterranei S699]AGT86268.1 hypothetical protein B737_5604 [Amycolatopsis mediterranei RB]KDO12645.1 hypothetical protein DV26_01635 [Amycolatopsis mediterranei]
MRGTHGGPAGRVEEGADRTIVRDRVRHRSRAAERSSCTAPLDVVRLAPGDDVATVTAAQVRGVVNRLIVGGHRQSGDPDILLVAGAGYVGPRASHVLADLPIVVLVRMRSDRVLRRPAPPHPPGTMGRPRRHGGEFAFGDPSTWAEPEVAGRTKTRLYGPAHARAWDPAGTSTVQTDSRSLHRAGTEARDEEGKVLTPLANDASFTAN